MLHIPSVHDWKRVYHRHYTRRAAPVLEGQSKFLISLNNEGLVAEDREAASAPVTPVVPSRLLDGERAVRPCLRQPDELSYLPRPTPALWRGSS